MNSLLASGLLALTYVVGRWTLGRSLAYNLRRSVLAHYVLAFVVGIALVTPPLAILAAVGIFNLAWLGALGWIIAVAASFRLAQRASVLRARQRFDIADIVVLVAAVVFVVAAAFGRDETLGAGRDQQVYAEAAVALSDRGTASTTYAPLDEADRALLRNISGTDIPDVRDKHAGVDVPITLTHPLSWPAWLAVAHAMFGIEGVYAANSIVFALGGLLFFLLLRCLVSPAIAAAATLLLFALPSSLWIAGISLSEPLAMTLLLAVPLLGASGVSRSSWRIAAVLAAATLIRIDAALAVPAVMGAALFARLAVTADRVSTDVRRFALIQLFGFGTTMLIYWAISRIYLYDNFAHLAIVIVTSLALVAAAFLPSRGADRFFLHFVDSSAARLMTIAVLLALFTYAAAIRPTLQPFSIFPQTSVLAGTRDFREDSVLNLAVYLSWPILFAALGGVCYALWKRWPTRGGLLRPLILVLGLGPALVYLWFPDVSPDHPWAFRRFLPTVVPYTLLFATLFVHALTRRIARAGAAVGALALAAPYTLIASAYPLQRILMRENDGITRQIESIVKQLPDGLILSVGVDRGVAASMLIAYGKPVVIVGGNLTEPNDLVEVGKWIQAKIKLGHPAWLLHDPRWSRVGSQERQLDTWRLTRQYLARPKRPPAVEAGAWTSQIVLSRIDGFDTSFATRMFGGEPLWGVVEKGFFAEEVAPFGAFRYTDGHAWIDVPAIALRDAEAIKLDVFPFAREGEKRWLHVLINGLPTWSGSLATGVSTLRVPLLKPTSGDVARIELLSEAIDPSKISPGDPRESLSIGVIGIRILHPGEPAANGSGIRGFRSSLSLIDVPSWPLQFSSEQTANFVLDVRNAGREYWPGVNELGSPVGAIQIALRWHRHNEFNSLVGDNRWPLFISLLSGDHTRVKVPLAPIGLDGKPLPPGEYEVSIGMVRETVALFADNGDATLSIPVVITP